MMCSVSSDNTFLIENSLKNGANAGSNLVLHIDGFRLPRYSGITTNISVQTTDS